MNPHSLRSTLPTVDLETCQPARAAGFVRCFDVAFPNDGSQPDKEYVHPGGEPPERVLLCNIRPSEHYAVNGVCIPVDDDALALLRTRERRYDLVDITARVVPFPAQGVASMGPVFAFVGSAQFTGAHAVGGIASRAYLDTIITGAKYWDVAAPEFYHLAMASTEFPQSSSIASLKRIDL